MAWIDFLSHIPWELLVTLTFDPKKAFPVNRDLAGREAFEWCGLLARTVRRPVAYVIALERHRSGQFHAHVLLVGTGGDISGPAAMWTQRNGIIHIRPVSDGPKAVLHETEEAALSGELCLSDTLDRYRDYLTERPRILLYPSDDEGQVVDGAVDDHTGPRMAPTGVRR